MYTYIYIRLVFVLQVLASASFFSSAPQLGVCMGTLGNDIFFGTWGRHSDKFFREWQANIGQQ